MIRVLILLLVATPAFASGKREYPYPSDPQYQYPTHNDAKRYKCPNSQKVWQGNCRVVRPVVSPG